MTEELATNLRLKRYPHAVSLNGLGKQVHSKYYVITTLLSSSRSYSTQPITFAAVVPHLVCTTVPEDKDEILASATLQNASLADPELGGRVNVFLGNLELEDIVLSTYKDGKLRIIATPYGISVAGPISKGSSSALAVTSAVPDDLQNNLSRLWELDRVPEAPTHSPDDAKVLEHFNDTVRTVNGRISVTLPMKTDPPHLGDSRRQAMSRLFANEKSLSSRTNLMPLTWFSGSTSPWAMLTSSLMMNSMSNLTSTCLSMVFSRTRPRRLKFVLCLTPQQDLPPVPLSTTYCSLVLTSTHLCLMF